MIHKKPNLERFFGSIKYLFQFGEPERIWQSLITIIQRAPKINFEKQKFASLADLELYETEQFFAQSFMSYSKVWYSLTNIQKKTFQYAMQDLGRRDFFSYTKDIMRDANMKFGELVSFICDT